MEDKKNQEYYSVGRVKEAHGLKGELYIKLRSKQADWLSEIDQIILSEAEYPKNLKFYSIKKAKVHKDGLIVTLLEVNNRTEAEKCHGKFMLIPTSILLTANEDNFYFYEIEGFEVIDEQQRVIGLIIGFGSNGAQDLIQVKGPFGIVDIPFIDNFITKIDFKEKKVFMHLPEGLVEVNEV